MPPTWEGEGQRQPTAGQQTRPPPLSLTWRLLVCLPLLLRQPLCLCPPLPLSLPSPQVWRGSQGLRSSQVMCTLCWSLLVCDLRRRGGQVCCQVSDGSHGGDWGRRA